MSEISKYANGSVYVSPRKSDEPRRRQSVHDRVVVCMRVLSIEGKHERDSEAELAVATVVRRRGWAREGRGSWVRPCRLGRRGDEPSGRRPSVAERERQGRFRELEPSGAEGRSRRVRSVKRGSGGRSNGLGEGIGSGAAGGLFDGTRAANSRETQDLHLVCV